MLIVIGQFGAELSAIGVPGIWFPFRMGVSFANYAYLFTPKPQGLFGLKGLTRSPN